MAAAIVALGAVRAEAATLGAVTRAANHCRMTIAADGGGCVTVVRRDAMRYTPRPAHVAARPWRQRVPAEPAPPRPLVEPCVAEAANPRRGAALESQARARKRKLICRATADDAVRDILARQAGTRTPSSNDAADVRLAALRRRIAAKRDDASSCGAAAATLVRVAV